MLGILLTAMAACLVGNHSIPQGKAASSQTSTWLGDGYMYRLAAGRHRFLSRRLFYQILRDSDIELKLNRNNIVACRLGVLYSFCWPSYNCDTVLHYGKV